MYIIVSNYSRNSLALIIEMAINIRLDQEVMVVNVDTSWQAEDWLDYVRLAQEYVKGVGFKPITLKPAKGFSQLVEDRGEFPSVKFQWCATFLKGMTLLDWLDEIDLGCQAEILLAARQDMGGRYRYLTERIESSEHYGGRRIWYPLVHKTKTYCDKLLLQAGLSAFPKSQECFPCIMATKEDYVEMTDKDLMKIVALEEKIQQCIHPELVEKSSVNSAREIRDYLIDNNLFLKDSSCKKQVEIGCGAPYGCGI